jgi:integrase
LPENKKRWPLALNIDRDFAVGLRSFLVQYQTTRNGRAGGQTKCLSARQIYNVLECFRTVVAWASAAAVRKLPAEWLNPFTRELVGRPPAKDPLREEKLPLDVRIRLVRSMDQWQLRHIGPLLVLPPRPDEAAGLLVSDVKFDPGWLEFGHTFVDFNFTKGGTAFRLPFAAELVPLLQACIGGRTEGPLFLSRRAFEQGTATSVSSLEQVKVLFDQRLLREPPGKVQTAHDRKLIFRRFMRELGGVGDDELNVEFKKLLGGIGVNNGATVYSLRSSVTTAMKNASLPHLELRYLTSHTTNDIINEYVTLDPAAAMAKYFESIRPLLNAIADRSRDLGLQGEAAPPIELSPLSVAERITF